MADDKPIIIVKKKGGHGGHHGGAWKVAYADFVTAMMAFFMVMWLVNSAETTTKQSIASYFRKPGIFQSGSGTPLLIGGSGILLDSPPPLGEEQGKKSASGANTSRFLKKSGTEDLAADKRITYRGEDGAKNAAQDEGKSEGIDTEDPGTFLSRSKKKEKLESISDEIEKMIQSSPELSELLGVIDIKVDADGLNIEIMDTEKSSMFSSGSAKISPEAQVAFTKIAGILAKQNADIDIVGHTDGKPFSSRNQGYSNWELSSDRANAARRMLISEGIKPESITSVMGRADKDLRLPEEPFSPSNRRITLKMKFDFNKTVDLSKDPEALNKIPEFESEYQEKLKIVKEKLDEIKQEKKVHSMTTKEITSSDDKKIIRVPQNDPARDRNIIKEKDKIFGDSPVFEAPIIFGD